MVKFLQHIFESLFYILDEHGDKLGELVFNCIVQIICQLADHKFQHFRPVLDSYIKGGSHTHSHTLISKVGSKDS